MAPNDQSVYRQYESMSPFEIKNKLISVAKDAARKSAQLMLNAGRGNPNWVATTPREAFFLLGQFAMAECKRVMDVPDLGGMPEAKGCAARLERFLAAHADAPGADFVAAMVPFAVMRFSFDADAFVHELTDAIVGDNYPEPDRMLRHAERVVQDYLAWALCDGRPPQGRFDLFAVEGGTAAMCYVFKSLLSNRILRDGDTIAVGTPIFTPYLEIPHIAPYRLTVIELKSTEENGFQFSDAELAKLEDPKVKALLLVNPANPSSVAVSPDVSAKLVSLVRDKRPDLLILTDDVYGTFVRGFRSLLAALPRNTIGVYSFSKYFGCTGWRLGVIALYDNHVLDQMLARLPAADRAALDERYRSLRPQPGTLKFIDRLVADSRDVALNHTAGLSLPQQAQMTLFALFQLMDDDDSYRTSTIAIVQRRLKALIDGLSIDVPPAPLYAAYYAIIDLEHWLARTLGKEVAAFVKANYHPLDIVARLAHDHAIVLLVGGGFAAPDWSVRVSLANLPDETYDDIGRAVRAVSQAYVEAYRFAGGGAGSSRLKRAR